MTKILIAVALVTGISSEVEAKSPVRGGKVISIRLGKARARGRQLAYASRGWTLSLELPVNDATCSAEFVDVTPKTFSMRFAETIAHHTKYEGIVLPQERYQAGHAYRATLSCAGRAVGSELVYLAPAPFKKRRNVNIDEAEARGDSSDEIAMVAKGAL